MITVQQLEQAVNHTGIYLGVLIAMCIASFNLGLLIGFAWVSLL